MDQVINWELLRHPYNWIIVILMLALFIFALTALAEPLQHVGQLVNVF